MWKQYFSIIGCTKFVMHGIGEIDATKENMSLEKVKQAYEKGCQFVVPTPEGIDKFYPHLKKIEPKVAKFVEPTLEPSLEPKANLKKRK